MDCLRSGISWNAAFIAAMNDWNDATSFNFILRKEKKIPARTTASIVSTLATIIVVLHFGENTLAVAVISYQSLRFWVSHYFRSNIIVDQSKQFNMFDGNLSQFGIRGGDFRRVALHELGHAIGLGHETSNKAIMALH